MTSLVDALGGLTSNPKTAGLMGLAEALLAAGGPHRFPVSVGQGLAAGLQNAQQMRAAMLHNKLTESQLPQAEYFGAMWKHLLGQAQHARQPQPASQPVAASYVTPQMSPLGNSAMDRATARFANGQPDTNALGLPSPDAVTQAPQSPTQNTAPSTDPYMAGLETVYGKVPQGVSSLAYLSAIQKNPGSVFSAEYTNSPSVAAAKARAIAEGNNPLAIDLDMAQRAPKGSPQQMLWMNKAYNDGGALQHTWGSVYNTITGQIWSAGKAPAGFAIEGNQMVPIPGGPQAVRQSSQATEFGSNQAKQQAEDLKTLGDFAQRAKASNQNLQEMLASDTFHTNAYTPAFMKMRDMITSIGTQMGVKPDQQVSNYQELQKYSRQLAFNLSQQTNSRAAYRMVELAIKANPNASLQGMSSLAKSLVSANDYAIAENKYLQDLGASNSSGIGAAKANFLSKTNPLVWNLANDPSRADNLSKQVTNSQIINSIPFMQPESVYGLVENLPTSRYHVIVKSMSPAQRAQLISAYNEGSRSTQEMGGQ